METGGPEENGDDGFEEVLAELGIHPPFFWEQACSKERMAEIAMSGLSAQAKHFNNLVSMTPEKWQGLNSVDRACLRLRMGEKVGRKFPDLFDELIEKNDSQSLKRLSRASQEGMLPNDKQWQAFLIEWWAWPVKPLGINTPKIPPSRKKIRVTRDEALSWPFAFWADPALTRVVKDYFPACRVSVKMIRDLIDDYGLVRNKPTVVQFDERFELRHYG
jgi:hypothetical protein